tara:strand:- start:873 stop:5432 length:4560 start_codon:yes stop_codon:yes gene_type:complete
MENQFASFEDLTEETETLDLDIADPIDPSSPLEETKVEELSVITGADPEEIQQARIDGDMSYDNLAVEFPDMSSFLDTLYKANVPVEDAGRLAQDYLDRKKAAVTPTEFIFKSILLADDDGTNPVALRMFSNYEMAKQMLAKRMEKNDPSYFKWVVAGTGEFAREVTYGLFAGIFKADQKASAEYASFLRLPAEDAAAAFNEKFDDLENRGLFNLREFEGNKDAETYLDNFGTDPNADFNMFLGLAELATLGSTKLVAKGVGRLAGKGIDKGIEIATDLEILKKVMKAKTPSEAVTAVKGEVEGAKVVVAQMNNKAPSTPTAGKAGPSSLDPVEIPSDLTPHLSTVEQGTTASMLFNKIEKIAETGVLGRTFSREALAKEAGEVAKRLAANKNAAFVKVARIITKGSDLADFTALLGKSETGTPFATKAEALKAARNDPRYTPVKRDGEDAVDTFGLNEGKRGWYLKYVEAIDTSKLADEIADVTVEENFLKRAVAGIVSAGQSTLGSKLGFMFNNAESLINRVSKISDNMNKSVRQLSKEEFGNVNKVLLNYRDSPIGDNQSNLAVARKAPSDAEFSFDYKRLNGTLPSDKELEAYRAITDFNNTSWNIKATELLKNVISRGGWSVEVIDGFEAIGVEVATDTLTTTDFVFSPLTGKVKAAVVGERTVYKLDEPFTAANGDKYIYVTDVADVRTAQKSDVLGYNVGGSRNNETVTNFIGTLDEVTLVGGKSFGENFRTFIGAYSKKEGARAVKELNTLIDTLEPLMLKYGKTNIADLNLSKVEADEFAAVLAKNNDWNLNITTFKDLKDIAAKHKMPFKQKFVSKLRDEEVRKPKAETDFDPSMLGMKVGDSQSAKVARKRGDTPLMTYGGARVSNASPIDNIMEQMSSDIYSYSHHKVTQAALLGWVKKAKGRGNATFASGVEPNDPAAYLRQAKVKQEDNVDADMFAQQAVLLRRLNLQERGDRLAHFADQFNQFIYDTKVIDKLSKTPIVGPLIKGDTIKSEDWIDKGAGKARALAFQLKMGFFEPSQFVLNASHVGQVIAMAGFNGTKAAGATPVIAMLLQKSDAGIKKDLDRLFKNGWSGMSREEILDTIRFMRETGRDVVGSNTLERQGEAFKKQRHSRAARAMEAGLEAGLTPYKYGDLMGRIAATATAILEQKAKTAGDDVFSDAGREAVSNREQILTFRMTSGQKGQYQENALAGLATQWMSYTVRYLDNVLIGRDLTGKERRRLFAANTIMFGTRGMGLTPRMSAALANLGQDPEDGATIERLNFLKFGLFDYGLSQLAGTDVSLGVRLAPAAGLVQTYSDILQGDVIGAVAGPSGTIATDILETAKVLTQTLTGGHNRLTADTFKVLTRNVKSADMYSKIVELIETGEYRSKRRGLAGTFSDSEVSFGLKMALVSGATPMRVLNHYDAKDISYKDDTKFKDARRRITTWADKGIALIQTGDPAKVEQGKEYFNDVMNLIEDGGFSVENQFKLHSSVASAERLVDLIKKSQGQSIASKATARAAQGEQ